MMRSCRILVYIDKESSKPHTLIRPTTRVTGHQILQMKETKELTLQIAFSVDDDFVAGVHPQGAIFIEPSDFFCLFLIAPVPM
jgi:hypothetical protein